MFNKKEDLKASMKFLTVFLVASSVVLTGNGAQASDIERGLTYHLEASSEKLPKTYTYTGLKGRNFLAIENLYRDKGSSLLRESYEKIQEERLLLETEIGTASESVSEGVGSYSPETIPEPLQEEPVVSSVPKVTVEEPLPELPAQTFLEAPQVSVQAPAPVAQPVEKVIEQVAPVTVPAPVAPAPVAPAPAPVVAQPAPAPVQNAGVTLNYCGAGGQALVDSCAGLVLFTPYKDYDVPSDVYAIHWDYGGYLIPSTPGSIVHIKNVGTFRITGIEAVLSYYTQTTDNIPRTGTPYYFQTCLGGDASRMAFIGAVKI